MKKTLISLAILTVGTSLALTATTFANDYAPANAVPLVKVINNIHAAGYKSIHEVDYDDGAYHAEIFNVYGEKLNLNINAATGTVSAQTHKALQVSMLKAIQIAHNSGCTQAAGIELEHGSYEVKCLKNNQEQMKVFIDTQTGHIVRTKHDD